MPPFGGLAGRLINYFGDYEGDVESDIHLESLSIKLDGDVEGTAHLEIYLTEQPYGPGCQNNGQRAA